jgi:hypothetical protein
MCRNAKGPRRGSRRERSPRLVLTPGRGTASRLELRAVARQQQARITAMHGWAIIDQRELIAWELPP